MIAAGEFVFKSFTERESGSFVTQDGELIEYKAAYILKFDEITSQGEVFERRAKVELDDRELIQKLLKISRYQKITLDFKVDFVKDNSARLKLIDVATIVEEQ